MLGRDPVQRRAVKRWVWATLGYALLWSLLLAAVFHGVADASAIGVVIYGLAGQLAFYAVLRSGLTRRAKDPLLTFPQVVYGITGVALTYGLQSFDQGPALQLLFLLLFYDLHRLTPRQIGIAAALATVLLAGTVVGMYGLRPTNIDWRQEAFTLIMAALAMPALAVIGRIVRGVHLRRLTQKAELAQALIDLQTLSQRDALTGAFNRRHMASLLDDEVRRHKRTGRPFCLAMLDIDFFKRVNDSHGHAVGDVVLQELTRLVRENLPATDVIARWGGEEFLVLLPEATAADALAAFEHVRRQVRAFAWSSHAPGLQVSFSCGVAEHQGQFSLTQTIERADAALYLAKQSGRDRIEADPACAAGTHLRQANGASTASDVAPHAAVLPRPQTCGAASRKPAPKRRATPLSRLGDWVWGADPKVRLSTQLCMVSSALYVCWIIGLLYSEQAGYMTPAVTRFVTAYYAVGMLAFYPLVRSGWTARWQDMGLVQAQILWGASSLIIVYPFNPTLRAAVMETLCLQQLFGLFALRPRKLIATGLAIIGMQLAMLVSAPHLHPAAFDVGEETFKVLYSCGVIAMITWISVHRSLDKARMLANKKQLATAVEQVNELVTRDPLTGLFNRKHMQELLARESTRQAQTGQPFCVALIDLDHFKRVNDTHGHQVGDEVLCSFAKAAQAQLRETDTIARWGGEEFLILMPETSLETDGKVPMDRLHQHIAALQPSTQVPELRFTFSAGLAAHDTARRVDDTIALADRALYAAKDGGRNRTVLASPNR